MAEVFIHMVYIVLVGIQLVLKESCISQVLAEKDDEGVRSIVPYGEIVVEKEVPVYAYVIALNAID